MTESRGQILINK